MTNLIQNLIYFSSIYTSYTWNKWGWDLNHHHHNHRRCRCCCRRHQAMHSAFLQCCLAKAADIHAFNRTLNMCGSISMEFQHPLSSAFEIVTRIKTQFNINAIRSIPLATYIYFIYSRPYGEMFSFLCLSYTCVIMTINKHWSRNFEHFLFL